MWSLRARLLVLLGTLFLVGQAMLYVAARSYAGAAADRSFDRLIAGSARSIAESLSVDGEHIDVDIPYSALDMLSASPDDQVFYRVSESGDRTITGYEDLPRSSFNDLGGEPGVEPSRFFDAEYRGERMRFVVIRRQIGALSRPGWVAIEVGQSRHARDDMARELVIRSLLPIATLTTIALLVTWFGIAHALRPLAQIERELSTREALRIEPLPTSVPREIVPLVTALNTFMSRSGEAVQFLRAFIAEAAHQMRTPLAALRAQAQVGRDGDQAEMCESLDAIERNAARLSRLLDQLLSEATVTHRSDHPHRENCDLEDVVRQAIHDGLPRSREVPVTDRSEGSLRLLGDPLMLCEAVKNLLDNAVRYGDAANAGVSVLLRKVDDQALLEVGDRGAGIAAGSREYLFKRFARGTSNLPGAGLGLAIVERIIVSHGGTISLRDTTGGGLTVSVRLPAQP